MERIIDEENDWDHDVEGDAVEGPVVGVRREGALQALSEAKKGIAAGASEVSLELIAASVEIEIQVIAEICQRV